MQAILLAGGLGTRLRSVVSDRPKPMALIEDKPFMEYVTRELVRSGITEIIFAVGYKGSMVEEYFKDGSGFGFHASYAYEETLLGTAGAIKNAGRFITEDRFYVLNADTFYQIDYTRLAKQQDEQDQREIQTRTPYFPIRRTARKASCGISTEPTCFIRFLPAFCFSSNFFLREMSPP